VSLEKKEAFVFESHKFVNSREEAKQAILAIDRSSVIKIDSLDYIGENKYYYSFRKIFTFHNANFTVKQRVNILKNFDSWDGFFTENAFNTKTLTDIMDMTIGQYHEFSSIKSIYRSVVETDDEFIYIYYRTHQKSTHVLLERFRHVVDKSTGQWIDFNDNISEADYDVFARLKKVRLP